MRAGASRLEASAALVRQVLDEHVSPWVDEREADRHNSEYNAACPCKRWESRWFAGFEAPKEDSYPCPRPLSLFLFPPIFLEENRSTDTVKATFPELLNIVGRPTEDERKADGPGDPC